MSLAGEFNLLQQVGVTRTGSQLELRLQLPFAPQVSPEQWEVMEALIRSTKGS